MKEIKNFIILIIIILIEINSLLMKFDNKYKNIFSKDVLSLINNTNIVK